MPAKPTASFLLTWGLGTIVVALLGGTVLVLMIQSVTPATGRVSTSSAAPAPAATRPRGYVSRAEFGAPWPLTVEDGVLSCVNGSAVIFAHGGMTYAVNGRAKGLKRYASIEPIWQTLDSPLSPMRVNIGPLIERGLTLCRK
jgi:hypothetical protein